MKHIEQLIGEMTLAEKLGQLTMLAADDATNRAADHRADRTRGVVAHIGAMGDAVGNALRLCRERRNQRCGDNGGCEHNLELHADILS